MVLSILLTEVPPGKPPHLPLSSFTPKAICMGCYHRLPQDQVAWEADIYFLIDLKFGKSKVKVWMIWVPW